MPPDKLAIVTVVSDDFLPGTLTMIESFRRTNLWFEGDVILIHPPLRQTSLTMLKAYDPGLIPRPISASLSQRMAEVAKHAGWTSGKELQFASIEALSVEEYDKIVFFDSDLLFIESIEETVRIDAALVACGDGAYIRGNRRRISDFAEVGSNDPDDISSSIGNTFNSGLMILDTGKLTIDDYHALLSAMEPDRWADDRTGHTDQMLLNLHFAGRQTLVPQTYNYMLSHRNQISSATGAHLCEAKVLHFTGPQKPWLPFEALSTHGMDRDFFAAYSKWRRVYDSLCRQRGLHAASTF